ncbi:M4 family metallopeptidase [Hymenobacter sp. ASUV-10]|uniref:M4 family metallopeptidase n=1 Tax=Hymenobacter aranciens TaxID=3063996 RepID=A0ABT9B534_9BACT|nr:M4 family metallopeptidase [Hymenobacter sp. ASUV-10]MDO7873376.1 M4 family metallopeptidase [Hymenobacter sp. ASUV-10]
MMTPLTSWLNHKLALLTVLLLAAGPALAQAPPAARPAPSRAAAELAEDGTPFLIRLPAASQPPAGERQRVLREQLALGAGEELRLLRHETDPLGFSHERFQQYYKGVKVEHGQFSTHERNGRIELLSGELKRPAAGLRVRPALSEAVALQRALAIVGARRYKWQDAAEEAGLRARTGNPRASYQPKGELVLVGDFRQPAAGRALRLAWKFDVYAQAPISRDLLYVDAASGELLLRDAIIKHLDAPGTLATKYLGTRTSTTEAFAGGYRLRETTRGKGVTTLNAKRSTNLAAAVDFVDQDNNWTAAEYDNAAMDNVAFDAHIGAQATQDYWVTQHGRDSYDDKGTVLLSYVHYDANLANAMWDGAEMLYGDGGGIFRPLTAVDICGHEIGHAVCGATAGLIYSNESGALNEGFSDIWGACVEHHLDPTKQTWKIGEDISFGGGALRTMSNPNAESNPDTYLGTHWYTGPGDNGGVHHNSGVLNFWFYLLSQGGSGSNDFGTAYAVPGIGITKAAHVAYRAERLYLGPSSNYAAASKATLQAALDLFGFGSGEVAAVAQAWRAVGLGQAAPTIGGLAPGSGAVGTVVLITGTNLSSATQVTFNGVPAAAGTLVSATQLSVVVQAGATTGPVTVTTPGGAASSPGVFTVTGTGPAPTISSYAPAAGQRTGATVVITGTNLAATSAVTIGGVGASFVINSPTQLTLTVPATAPGGPLRVLTPGGAAAAPFAVLPYLSGFAPASGAVGAVVTLAGTSLANVLSVKFGAQYATFTNNTATSLTATVPVGAVTAPITVRTAVATATSLTDFVVNPSLTISSFAPAGGAVGARVTVRGAGFTGATAFTFNGVAAAFTVASDTEIWATVPAGASTGRLRVTAPLGPGTSGSDFVVFVPGAPLISSFVPAYGTVGRVVTLTGSNFTGSTEVRFNGVPAVSFSVASGSSLTATVPAGASTGPISVRNAAGTGQSLTDFRVVPVPPNDLCTAPNLPVLACGVPLDGSTLGASRTGDPSGTCTESIDAAGGVFYRFVGTGNQVSINTCGTGPKYDGKLFVFTGTCGSYQCVGGDDDGCGGFSTGAVVTFASTAGTNYLVYVAGWSDKEGDFTIEAVCTVPPVILSFAPGSGPVGTAVTLRGQGLAGTTEVTFNGTVAPAFTVTSDSTLTVTVPAGASTGLVRLSTPVGAAVSSTPYTVTAPDLTVSTPLQLPGGTFNHVTILSGGNLDLRAPLVVEGVLRVADGGRLSLGCQPITGPGSFVVEAGGGIIGICDAAGLTMAGNAGAVRVAGLRTYSDDATYHYVTDGVADQVTGPGLPARVRQLITGSDGPRILLSQPLAVRQVLRLASDLHTNGHALTLLSDSAGTALVVNTGGVLQGAATVQRWIRPSANAGPGYRHYASPVGGATVASLATPGFVPVVNAAYNAATVPGLITPFPTVFGYDESRLATSPATSLSAFDKGWTSPAAVGEGLTVGRGYTVHLAPPAKVALTGPLHNGDYTLTLPRSAGPLAAEAGWHLLGNPYPAPLDWSLVAPADRAGLDASIYVFESSGPYTGTFRSYLNGIGGGSPLVASGQGFWVRVSAGQPAASLTFRNSQRRTTFADQATFRRPAADLRPQLHLTVRGAGTHDDTFLYAEAGATLAAEPAFDATKLPNPSGLNLASLAGGQALAIQGLPLALGAETVIPLTLAVPAAGSYTFEVAGLANFGATRVYLRDAATGAQQLLTPGATYACTVPLAGAGRARFALVLAPAGALATAVSPAAGAGQVFPNPSTGRFTVRRPAAAAAGPLRAELLNGLGQVVLTATIDGPAAELDARPLARGVYVLRLTGEAGTHTLRVVLE